MMGESANVSRSEATCPPSYEWTLNACSQDPCLVGAHLQSPCNEGFVVTALEENELYSSSGNDLCQCNTVVYSLFSACAACQGRNYIPWSAWSSNCSTTYNASYPLAIPQETSIPAWAFMPLSASDSFNINAARNLAAQGPPDVYPWDTDWAVKSSYVGTSSVPISISSEVSASTSEASIFRTTTVQAAPTTTQADGTSETTNNIKNVNIAWAVVGAFATFILVLLALYYYVSQRRKRKPNDILYRKLDPFPSPGLSENGFTNSNRSHRRDSSADTTTPLMVQDEKENGPQVSPDPEREGLPPLITSTSSLSLPISCEPMSSTDVYSPATASSGMHASRAGHWSASIA